MGLSPCVTGTGTSTVSDVATVALRAASLNEQQVRDLFRQGEEVIVFALLDLTKQLAEAQGKTAPSITPSTPSGMIPTCKKPPGKGRGKNRPGGKPGHPGARCEIPRASTGKKNIV